MRDPERMAEVLRVIHRIWRKEPDMRLGQLLMAVIPAERIFNIEDHDLVRELQACYFTLRPEDVEAAERRRLKYLQDKYNTNKQEEFEENGKEGGSSGNRSS